MPETAPKKILPKTRDDEKPHHANSFVTARVENNHRPEPEEGYHPSRHAFITGRPGDLYYCSTLALAVY
jgi:hypothetical protein